MCTNKKYAGISGLVSSARAQVGVLKQAPRELFDKDLLKPARKACDLGVETAAVTYVLVSTHHDWVQVTNQP